MKKLLAIAIAGMGALAAVVPTAHAVNVTNSFTVDVTLTSQCEATNSGTQSVIFPAYSAFQVGALANTTDAVLSFKCTRGFFGTPTVAFDTVNANTTAGGIGVLAGLQYQLTNTAAAVVAGTAETGTLNGTPDTRSYTITGSIAANQAGACAGTSCNPTHTRQVILSY